MTRQITLIFQDSARCYTASGRAACWAVPERAVKAGRTPSQAGIGGGEELACWAGGPPAVGGSPYPAVGRDRRGAAARRCWPHGAATATQVRPSVGGRRRGEAGYGKPGTVGEERTQGSDRACLWGNCRLSTHQDPAPCRLAGHPHLPSRNQTSKGRLEEGDQGSVPQRMG